MLILMVGGTFHSCQKDSFTEPIPTPKKYVFRIPGKLDFSFSQVSKTATSPTPYQNTFNCSLVITYGGKV